MKIFKRVLIGLLIFIVVVLIAMLVYFEIYYHAEDVALDCLDGSSAVKVSEIDVGYFFDGPGDEFGLIFYPGAKVETEAYAKLMTRIAENGVDCFLIDMPFRFAFLGANKADKILDSYDYKYWGISGHSLGGVVASSYACKNVNRLDVLILLASYPTKKIDDKISFLSIYGDKDGVLDLEAYNDGKKLWPANGMEFVINGGNHAGFGDYGEQKGDKESGIDNDMQQISTSSKILELFYRMTE